MDDKSGVERLNEVQNSYIILNTFPEITLIPTTINLYLRIHLFAKIHLYLKCSVICKYEQRDENPFSVHSCYPHLLLYVIYLLLVYLVSALCILLFVG